MKLLIHDYAGHPFQVELSRQLARRGHDVVHGFFAGDPGPKGELERRESDPPHLTFAGIAIDRPYRKGSFIRRRFDDVAYGRRTADLIGRLEPDLVISGNTPTEAQESILAACRNQGCAFVFWVQDFYSIAALNLLRKKFGPFGAAVGNYYRLLERRQLRRSDAIVIITEQFRPLACRLSGFDDRIHTIENWGALSAIRPSGKDNEWSRRYGLVDSFNFVYSGTLGLKHNPMLLVELARRTRGTANVVVVAQGSGTEPLRKAQREEGLDNLLLLPLQPPARLSQVLASADVAVAVVERDAGIFSVPSKVQSYLCAERAILLAAPRENLAARVVERECAGLVVDADDVTGFVDAGEKLRRDPLLRDAAARRGRVYAVRAYDICGVADRFEHVFRQALGARAPGVPESLSKEGV